MTESTIYEFKCPLCDADVVIGITHNALVRPEYGVHNYFTNQKNSFYHCPACDHLISDNGEKIEMTRKVLKDGGYIEKKTNGPDHVGGVTLTAVDSLKVANIISTYSAEHNKIAAIREIRKLARSTLKETKLFVEQHPEWRKYNA